MKFVAIFAFALLTSCGQTPAQQEHRELACKILTDFVTDEFDAADRPLYLSEDWERLDDDVSVDEWVKNFRDSKHFDGRSESDVRSEIKLLIALSKLDPLAECPTVNAIKQARSHTPAVLPEYGQMPELSDDGLFYLYDSLAISMPFIDVAKNKAYFEVSRVCGPLCGSGAQILYKRDDSGNWLKHSEVGTWIS